MKERYSVIFCSHISRRFNINDGEFAAVVKDELLNIQCVIQGSMSSDYSLVRRIGTDYVMSLNYDYNERMAYEAEIELYV